MSEQRYKERICEEVKKIDDLEMLRRVWLIAEGMLAAGNENRGGNRNAITGD